MSKAKAKETQTVAEKKEAVGAVESAATGSAMVLLQIGREGAVHDIAGQDAVSRSIATACLELGEYKGVHAASFPTYKSLVRDSLKLERDSHAEVSEDAEERIARKSAERALYGLSRASSLLERHPKVAREMGEWARSLFEGSAPYTARQIQKMLKRPDKASKQKPEDKARKYLDGLLNDLPAATQIAVMNAIAKDIADRLKRAENVKASKTSKTRKTAA